MKRKKALRKDLRNRLSGSIEQLVQQEDPNPSKKVKKIIKRTSDKLARAVVKDAKRAEKKNEKVKKELNSKAAQKKTKLSAEPAA